MALMFQGLLTQAQDKRFGTEVKIAASPSLRPVGKCGWFNVWVGMSMDGWFEHHARWFEHSAQLCLIVLFLCAGIAPRAIVRRIRGSWIGPFISPPLKERGASFQQFDYA